MRTPFPLLVGLVLMGCSSEPPPLAPIAPIAPIAPPDTESPQVSSSRHVKRDIRYIDDLDAFALRDDVVGLRLATFHYVDEPSDARAHLGIIIEDNPALLAIDSTRRSVDLYTYVSMAVAAIQVQQAEIDQLSRELHAQKPTSECASTQLRADR